ncbi:MAG: hypothetical protein AAF957_07260 [Planctomycetota bacterium]
MPPAFSDDDRRVILALAQLFLDTETERFEDAIAAECNAAGVGPERVEELLFDVVAPLLTPNRRAVAGEWSGFDEDWLMQRVAVPYRALWLRRLMRAWRRRDLEPQWTRIRKQLHLPT